MSKYIFSFILQALFLLACAYSLIIYTSLMSVKLPWYEPCGLQFLTVLIVSCPVMISVGIAQIIFGKFANVSCATKAIPFVAAIILGLLLFVCGSLDPWMQITGTAICILAAVTSIFFYILDMRAWRMTDE